MKRFIMVPPENFGRRTRTGGGSYMLWMIRTVIFTQQKNQFIEPNQLRGG
jgi:hypothetical protein